MDVVISTVMWKYSLVYMDDIALFSKTPKDHIGHRGSVLRLLKDDGILLKLRGLSYLQTEYII